MRFTVVVLLAGFVMALGAYPAGAAPNLLTNPSFEEGWHGAFPTDDPNPLKQYAPTGWMNAGAQPWQYFQGVFDATWKNPPCDPSWPSALPPIDGSYALGHWFPPQDSTKCEYDNQHMDGRSHYIYQTVTGLTPNTTYYLTAYYATQHPHFWGMFRMVALPQTYDAQSGTFDPPLNEIYPIYTPLEEGGYMRRFAAPAETGSTSWPYFTAHWAGSDEKWSKLTCDIRLGENQNAVTVFLAYLCSSNNIAEPQYVQVDNVRLATHQQLEIKNVRFTNFTSNTATIEWDVMDGDAMVGGLGAPKNKTYVKYGPTSAYGQTVYGVEVDPVYCDGDRHGSPGHYAATISGLTQGNTYHFAIAVDEGTYTYIPPYSCPGEPVTGTRLYEATQTADDTFQMLPLLTITNVQATNVTSTTATITWTTNAASDSKVRYRMFDLPYEEQYNASQGTSHTINLTGLSPSTTYTYYVQSQGPGYNLTTSGPYTFQTTLGPNVMNGKFEFRATTGSIPKYWTDVPNAGGIRIHRGGEWSIPSYEGSWHAGAIVNGSSALNKIGCYQKVATTPGQIISFYAHSFASGQARWNNGCTGEGAVHRFGENNNQIGIDPTGAVPSIFNRWPNTIKWGEQLGSMDFGAYWPDNLCSHSATYRRLATCALATSSTATLYLRARCWYANNWVMNFFDDVYLEPPTELNSVSALKAQDMQLNVNLRQPTSGPGFVVTHVVAENPDPHENKGEPYFYIQDENGGPGIKVTLASGTSWPSWLAVGKKVNIIGTYDWGIFWNYTHQNDTGDDFTTGGHIAQQLRMNNPAGEAVVRAVVIEDAGTGTVPAPIGVTNRGLGGGSSADPWFTIAGVAGGTGANNVGMRVRVWGKIVEKVSDDWGQPKFLVIDDGSALPLNGVGMPEPHSLVAQSVPGLYIPWNEMSWPMLEDNSREIQVGDYAVITGISAIRLDLDWGDTNGWLDPGGSGNKIPEAMKNMPAIKVQESRFFASE